MPPRRKALLVSCNMMNFLKKYWFATVLMLVLFLLTFWLIPGQEKFYLESDYALIKKGALTFLIWTLSIGALTIFILAVREVRNWKQVGNILMGIVIILMVYFFFLKQIILAGFLLLNRIDCGKAIKRKYTAAFFAEVDRRTPLIYDFREQKCLHIDNVKNIGKLFSLNIGDTVNMHFHEGLLGFPFAPEVK